MDVHREEGRPFKGVYPKTGRVISGSILIGIGLVFLAHQLGVEMPGWLFTWPVFLIALGLYVGAKHLFRNPGWLVMVVVGLVFLCEDIYQGFELHRFIIPFFLILAGVVVVFKPYKGRFNRNRFQQYTKRGSPNEFKDSFCNRDAEDSNDDVIDSTSIFGGVKKNILTKNFKGGEVICIMGGAEINLSHADIQGTVVLEMIQIFGGAKLIIPANWEIRSEAVVILGSIEDKRQQLADSMDTTNKVLILKGTCIFGGIDIKSY